MESECAGDQKGPISRKVHAERTPQQRISVVIPTYQRGELLLETIKALLSQSSIPHEIVVVDQTAYPKGSALAAKLRAYDQQGLIRWEQREVPSIPKAMNFGLSVARCSWVLFLDDDIRIDDGFIMSHQDALLTHRCAAQVGCVLQPGESLESPDPAYAPGKGLWRDLEFLFRGSEPATLYNCMAGNLLVHKPSAVRAGGFDERFEGAAYRFETEFARRLCEATGSPVAYSPLPVLNHLKAERGGTRSTDHFLTSSKSVHSSGDYYFALVCGQPWEAFWYCLKRFVTAPIARFYLVKPWYLPIRFWAEVRGLARAFALLRQRAADRCTH